MAFLGFDMVALTAEITAALPDGVECVADERDLNLPGALIAPELFAFDRLDGESLKAIWRIWLIERDSDPISSLNRLGEMLSALQENTGVVASDIEPQALTLPNHSPDGLPALTFTIQTEISERK